MNTWIRLYDGRKFHFLKPKVSEISIENIAHSLSQLCRFTGHTKKFYSVAQHSALVHDILPQNLKAEGLLHDSSESMAADLNTVIKSLLPQYKIIELKIEKIIAKKFNLKFPFPPGVKEADLRLLCSEMRDLMSGKDHKLLPYLPLDEKITPWSVEKSKKEFLKRFYKLYPDYKD